MGDIIDTEQVTHHDTFHITLERSIIPVRSEIQVQPGLLNEIPSILSQTVIEWRGDRLELAKAQHAVFSDSTVTSLYTKNLVDRMKDKGLKVVLFEFPEGEENKNLQTYGLLIDQIEKSEIKFGANTVVHAVGGGVTGDLAGYIAATYHRGVPFIQIPTSLLADVDSSIGGKVAIDSALAKNILGAFYEPTHVLIDPALLKTLPRRHLINGLAEVVKHGLLDDNLANLLVQQAGSLIPDDMNLLNIKLMQQIIEKSVEIKNRFVAADPFDKGVRRILNTGHTIGHAIEKVSHYELLHGEAVAIGMVTEGRIAAARGIWKPQDLEGLIILLNSIGLPTKIPRDFDIDEIMRAIWRDKKVTDAIELSIPVKGQSINDSLIMIKVGENEIQQIIKESTVV